MLNENNISDLINQSGRLRMLSHRAGMFITLLFNQPQIEDWFKQELDACIDKFQLGIAHIHDQVKQDEQSYVRFIQFIGSNEIKNTAIQFILEKYITDVLQIQTKLNNHNALPTEDLCDFLKFIASDLLLGLNQMVQFFENELTILTQNKSKKINQLATPR